MQPFTISNSDEVQAPSRLFTVIYGQPGAGKTSLTFTMPGPVLHLDFDKGIHRALQSSGHKTVSVTEYKGFRQWLFSDEFPAFIQNNGIKTIALDTVGTLLDDFIAPYLCEMNPKNGSGGSLSLQGWGAQSIEFGAVRARLLSAGTEVIGTAHEKEDGDGDARQLRLAVKGGSSDIIYRSCDLLGYLSMRGTRRVLDFNPTQMHVGKNVAGLPAIEIPDGEAPGYRTFMADKVITVAMEKISQRNSRRLEIEETLRGHLRQVLDLNEPHEFADFSAKMKQEPSSLIVAQVKQALSGRMKDAGIVFNPEAGQFRYVDEGLQHVYEAKRKAQDELNAENDPEEGGDEKEAPTGKKEAKKQTAK
jgi:hypothetical protein